MNASLNILLVEDNSTDAELLVWHLRKEGLDFSHKRVWDRKSFEEELGAHEPDIIIADYNLPQFNGLEAFRLMKGVGKNLPFILVTGSISEKLVIECTKDGIDDYLMKGNLLRLSRAIENVINKKRVENLHAKLQSVHSELKASINYAKMIQDSILPTGAVLSKILPKSFIYFQPKDTLSGDFYWFKKKDDILYIAVADCTGHGIPGGLLSMIGFNMLDWLTLNEGIISPSDLLKKLVEQFERINVNSGSKMKDGMDIAVCTIDSQNKLMLYAGANRPLYILRQNVLMEFKPDKMAIDGVKTKTFEFTDHRVTLFEGDRVFMFSDGFADQFHHSTNKKMLMKRLKDELLFTSVLDFEEQKKSVIKLFEDWRGDAEQTDDVLMLGFEISE